MLEKLQWEVYIHSPNAWLIAELEIGNGNWFICFKRPTPVPTEYEMEYLVSVFPYKWMDRRDFSKVKEERLADWRGTDLLIYSCILYEFAKEYGDERCKDGSIRRVGDETNPT